MHTLSLDCAEEETEGGIGEGEREGARSIAAVSLSLSLFPSPSGPAAPRRARAKQLRRLRDMAENSGLGRSLVDCHREPVSSARP